MNDKFVIYTYDASGTLHSQLMDDPIGYAEVNPTKTFMAVAPDGEFYLIPPRTHKTELDRAFTDLSHKLNSLQQPMKNSEIPE